MIVRLTAVFVLLLGLPACASRPYIPDFRLVWKPGQTDEMLRRDRYACLKEAQEAHRHVPQGRGWNQVMLGWWRLCMEARGWEFEQKRGGELRDQQSPRPLSWVAWAHTFDLEWLKASLSGQKPPGDTWRLAIGRFPSKEACETQIRREVGPDRENRHPWGVEVYQDNIVMRSYYDSDLIFVTALECRLETDDPTTAPGNTP